MISLDVKILLTNVPLDRTIAIILRKVYDEGKLAAKPFIFMNMFLQKELRANNEYDRQT